jgi:hypothetical protein
MLAYLRRSVYMECTLARLESLEIARRRFRKFNSKYIESIKIARRRYPPRDTNFPHWAIESCFRDWDVGFNWCPDLWKNDSIRGHVHIQVATNDVMSGWVFMCTYRQYLVAIWQLMSKVTITVQILYHKYESQNTTEYQSMLSGVGGWVK